MTKNNEALSTCNLVIILCSLFIGPFIFYAPIAFGGNPTLLNMLFVGLAIIGLTCVAISVYRVARFYPIDPFFSSVKEWGGATLGQISSACATLAMSLLILSYTAEAARNIASLFGIKYTQEDWRFGFTAPILSTNSGLILTGIIMLSLLLFFITANKSITRLSLYVFLSITTIAGFLTAIVCFKQFNVSNFFRYDIVPSGMHIPWFILLGVGLFIFCAASLFFAQQETSQQTQSKALTVSLFLIAIVYLVVTLSMLYAPQTFITFRGPFEGPLEDLIRSHLHYPSWLAPLITIGKTTGILGLVQALILATKNIAPRVAITLKELWLKKHTQLPFTILALSGAAVTLGFMSPWLNTIGLLTLIFFSAPVALSCITLIAKAHDKTLFESLTTTVGLITSSLVSVILLYILMLLAFVIVVMLGGGVCC